MRVVGSVGMRTEKLVEVRATTLRHERSESSCTVYTVVPLALSEVVETEGGPLDVPAVSARTASRSVERQYSRTRGQPRASQQRSVAKVVRQGE